MNSLRNALNEYISLRRNLGFKMEAEELVLNKFINFLEQNNMSYITTDMVLQWATMPRNASQAHWARRLTMARLFAQFYRAIDPRTEVPPCGLIPGKYQRKTPYIYSDVEISRLLLAAKELSSVTGMRSLSYFTLLGLLVVTGMRISEPIALLHSDVDLEHGILTVRNTKFSKSRLIPIHHSSVEILKRYSHLRKQKCPHPESLKFFISENGRSLNKNTVNWTFVKLSRKIGLRGKNDSHGPRLHDFRHTFAVKTLLNWYKTGVDVEAHISELSTYLGHTHVNDTYWYISAVPELLQYAMMRLEKVEGGLLS